MRMRSGRARLGLRVREPYRFPGLRRLTRRGIAGGGRERAFGAAEFAILAVRAHGFCCKPRTGACDFRGFSERLW